MIVPLDLSRAVMDYILSNRELFHYPPERISSIRYNDCHLIYMENKDKRSPSLLKILSGKDDSLHVIPFFSVSSHPVRQIISYTLGRTRCNLSELMEIDGHLYSRYAGSYTPAQLVHDLPVESKIALWVHDCLTEDVDHSRSLNRYSCTWGAEVSYDFGHAFSNRCFPPFYAWELGLGDNEIEHHACFLIDVIASYASLLDQPEDTLMDSITRDYPGTCHEGLCRYYIRSFKTHFPMRLYFGRIFEKISKTHFPHDKVSALTDKIGLHNDGLRDWKDLVDALRDYPRRNMNLQGLDLSGVDLRRADFRGVDLRGAILTEADLEQADLRQANISQVDLSGANLRNAQMEGVLR